MRKNILIGSVTTALLAAMLSISPALAEEAPAPPPAESSSAVLDAADTVNPIEGALDPSAVAKNPGLQAEQVREAPAAQTAEPAAPPVDLKSKESVKEAEPETPQPAPAVAPTETTTKTETQAPQQPVPAPKSTETGTPAPAADEAPATKTPETKTPETKVPETKAPALKAPVTEEPAAKTPATKTPETKTPATKAPASKTPVTKAPASKTPVTKAPASKTPVTEAPASKAPEKATKAKVPAPKAPAAKPAIAVTGVIATHWNSLKGAAGALGTPTAAPKKTSNYTSQQFTGGIIYATAKHGVLHVLKTGAIGKTWTAKGEAFYGFPISGEIKTAQGTYQKFSKNYSIFSNGASIQTASGIARKWQDNGGLKVMGMPASAEKCGQPRNGCVQSFAKGSVFWSPATGAQAVWGGILGRYAANGGTKNYIGYPTSKEECTLIRNGCYQNFERGLIMWSAQTGAYSVATGAIRSFYGGTGTANGYLGYPNSSETCNKLGCTQRFQGGVVYWSGITGAQGIRNGKILNAYNDRKAYSGELGFPRAAQVCGQPSGGCFQDFSNGRLWSNNGQTYGFRTNGGIGTAYYAKGGPRGNLGYPLTDEKCSGGQCVQTFQGGYIGWGPGAGGTYSMSECQYLNDGRSRYSAQGSKHVLLTFTQYYGQAYATNVYCKNIAGVYVTEWRTDGYVGASGFKGPGEASGPTRNLFSPTGSFTVTEAFGLGNPGTALSYRTLNPNSRWGGNPWTPTYNKYHESSSWTGWDENMWYFAKRSTHDYEQGAVINYNRPNNIVQDAGFAIFLHQNKVPTAGCISIDNWAMVDYLRKSVPGDRIIMGVRSALFK